MTDALFRCWRSWLRKLGILRGDIKDLTTLTAAMRGHNVVHHVKTAKDTAEVLAQPGVDPGWGLARRPRPSAALSILAQPDFDPSTQAILEGDFRPEW